MKIETPEGMEPDREAQIVAGQMAQMASGLGFEVIQARAGRWYDIVNDERRSAASVTLKQIGAPHELVGVGASGVSGTLKFNEEATRAALLRAAVDSDVTPV